MFNNCLPIFRLAQSYIDRQAAKNLCLIPYLEVEWLEKTS